MKNSTEAQSCRTCGNDNITNILDLGKQPLANALLESPNAMENLYPLEIFRCNQCGTVQLTETINPDILFNQYVWVTGTSSTAHEYSELFYERAIERSGKTTNFVIEIASNDGTFLKPFKNNKNKVLGVDPAKNIAQEACENGVPTICEFFGHKVANKIVARDGEADIVIARNVIPHVANAEDVIKGIATCLKNEGLGIIEFHSAEKILKELHYDSIYHEHLYYHSINSISFLLNKYQLNIFDIEVSPISGGSLVIYFSKKNRNKSTNLKKAIQSELNESINNEESWIRFAGKCKTHRDELTSLIKAEKRSGRTVVGYGASARSSTLMNFCSLDNSYIDIIADKAPLKHGKYTPGTHVLIESPDKVMQKNPETIVILAWNFKEEIISELRNKYNWKGRLIIPLPFKPSIIEIK